MRTMCGSPCLHYDCSNRNRFGYCKTTVCINKHYYQEELWGLPSTTNKTESVVIKQQTNADRIRAMTDEELAKFIEFVSAGCDYMSPDCPAHDNCKHVCDQNDACRKGWLDWLKQEVENDE